MSEEEQIQWALRMSMMTDLEEKSLYFFLLNLLKYLLIKKLFFKVVKKILVFQMQFQLIQAQKEIFYNQYLLILMNLK